MAGKEIGYMMWVVYGYTIWILGAYIWDWWKNLPARKKRNGEFGSTCDEPDKSTETDETTTPTAA